MKSQIKAKVIKKVPIQAIKPGATPAHKNRPTGPGKTFHKDGHWVENPHKASVLTCLCGNRYLKTRHGQSKCLRCVSQGR